MINSFKTSALALALCIGGIVFTDVNDARATEVVYVFGGICLVYFDDNDEYGYSYEAIDRQCPFN